MSIDELSPSKIFLLKFAFFDPMRRCDEFDPPSSLLKYNTHIHLRSHYIVISYASIWGSVTNMFTSIVGNVFGFKAKIQSLFKLNLKKKLEDTIFNLKFEILPTSNIKSNLEMPKVIIFGLFSILKLKYLIKLET